MRTRKIAMSIFMLLFLLPMLSFGAVNTKNGNFYVSYLDVNAVGGYMPLKLQRTYNSKSTYIGWFGVGWGNEFETYLSPAADGSVVVHEHGSGAMVRFVPSGKSSDAKASVEKIIASMREKGTVTVKQEKSLSKMLMNNAELRRMYARKNGVEVKVAKGASFISTTNGKQTISKTDKGYERNFSSGKKEIFSDKGKLSKISYPNGYEITFNYKGELLSSIKDTDAKQILFEWFSGGQRIKHAWTVGGQKAVYKYDGLDLRESKDAAGNVYQYDYDSNHNLTSVTYSDKRKMQVSYSKRAQFAEKVVDKDGVIFEYKYDSDKKNPELRYSTSVKRTVPGSTSSTERRYEYEIKVRPDGSRYTYRSVDDVKVGNQSKISTETVYNECCGLPSRITRTVGKKSQVTNFKYDSKRKNLLVEKKSSTEGTLKLAYHPKFDKITKVTKGKEWSSFEYYDKGKDSGKLRMAKDYEGNAILVSYNRKGRITKLHSTNKKLNEKKELSFQYNAQGKPYKISMKSGKSGQKKLKGVGTINVAYDDDNEIKKVESKAGPKLAFQVTKVFQSLLSIVKPAGVNFGI